MKTKVVSRSGAWVLAAVLGFALAACEEDKQPETVVSGPTAPLAVSSVISDPKVGEPGDTLTLTAVITSSAANEGDFPVMEWTANGGTFIENNRQTVRWISPATPGVFTITAKATNDVNSSTGKSTVYLGQGEELVHEFAGQVDLINGGPDFYYLYAVALVNLGSDTHQYVGGVDSDPIPPLIPPTGRQQNTTYSPDGTMYAFAADTTVFATITRPRHVYVGDIAGGTYTRLTVDTAKPGTSDRNQFDMPAFSPNGQVVAYQGFSQKWSQVVPDSFHVYIHDLNAQKRTRVTAQWDFPRAFFPSFSTDGNWLVYVMDTQQNQKWELYGSPMTGNDVDGSIASTKRLTDTGGRIITGAPSSALKRPPMRWNPVAPVLAVAAADDALHLVQMTPGGGTDISVPDVIKAPEFTWSSDGSMLAACYTITVKEGDTENAYARISTVGTSGAVTVRVTAPKGDSVRDLAFSPDGNWILYRVTRGANSWFNALDVGAGKLTEPVAVTAADPAGDAGAYRGLMSLSPRWTNANLMVYPSFTGSVSGTPGVFSRDLNGLVN